MPYTRILIFLIKEIFFSVLAFRPHVAVCVLPTFVLPQFEIIPWLEIYSTYLVYIKHILNGTKQSKVMTS